MKHSDAGWPNPAELLDHDTFRPEWSSGVECLYWYLTFDAGTLSEVVDGELGALVSSTPWVDPVPGEWMHLTLCEIGFVDQTGADDVDRALREVRESVARDPAFTMELGPALAFPRALVLAAGPLDDLRALQDRTRAATGRALGGSSRAVAGPTTYWPHVSVGYVNRAVSAAELAELRARLPDLELPPVPVERIVLASVLRRGRSYRWTVHAEVHLSSAAGST